MTLALMAAGADGNSGDTERAEIARVASSLSGGVANVADPLGGSWYVESLTDELEARAEVIFAPHANSLGKYGGNPAGWVRWRLERWLSPRTTVGCWSATGRRPSAAYWWPWS